MTSSDLKADSPSTVIVVNTDGIGLVDEPLRHKPIELYVKMLIENELYPGAIRIMQQVQAAWRGKGLQDSP